MSANRRVIVHPDKEQLAADVAERLVAKLTQLTAEQDRVDLCLTGGSVGIGILVAVSASPRRDQVDWTRVHFWWGDDRYLPADDAERNELQAREALLDQLDLAPEQLHPLPAFGVHADLETAARAAEAELAAAGEEPFPQMDLTLLGVGPDGHVASLFPGHATVGERERTVVAEYDSPKPPPERLSLTFPVINGSARVWLALAGADKAAALGLALAGARPEDVPAAGVEARQTTIFFVDEAAAADVPRNLIAPEDEWTDITELPES